VGAGDVFANEMIKARPPALQTAFACLDDLLGSVRQPGTRSAGNGRRGAGPGDW
jgi:hypothetical protein